MSTCICAFSPIQAESEIEKLDARTLPERPIDSFLFHMEVGWEGVENLFTNIVLKRNELIS